MRFSLKVYRLLLRLYPAGFRETYGVPLERQFRWHRSRRHLRLLSSGAALIDVAVPLPAQPARDSMDTRQAVRMWRDINSCRIRTRPWRSPSAQIPVSSAS